MKEPSKVAKEWIEAGIVTEEQATANVHPVHKIVDAMKHAEAEGTFRPGIIQLDFHESETPLHESIKVACAIATLCKNHPDVFLALTFPSGFPIIQLESHMKSEGFTLAKEPAASPDEGWIMYPYHNIRRPDVHPL
jgi:hypothetical protein